MTPEFETLAQEAIAMAAPVMVDAAGFTGSERPDMMDLAAIIMGNGLTVAGRTRIDEVGLDAALEAAAIARRAGDRVDAAGQLIAVTLRARELESEKHIAVAWARAIAWMS